MKSVCHSLRKHRHAGAQRPELLDGGEQQRGRQQVEDEPVDTQVRHVRGQRPTGSQPCPVALTPSCEPTTATASQNKAHADSRRTRLKTMLVSASAPHSTMADQQHGAHRVEAQHLAHLGCAQEGRKLEHQHGQHAEVGQHQRDHSADHALAAAQRPVRQRKVDALADFMGNVVLEAVRGRRSGHTGSLLSWPPSM
jgi:hypothetical protein